MTDSNQRHVVVGDGQFVVGGNCALSRAETGSLSGAATSLI